MKTSAKTTATKVATTKTAASTKKEPATTTATELTKQVQSSTRINFGKTWQVKTRDGILQVMSYVYMNDVRMGKLIKSYVEGAQVGFQYKGRVMPKAFYAKCAA